MPTKKQLLKELDNIISIIKLSSADNALSDVDSRLFLDSLSTSLLINNKNHFAQLLEFLIEKTGTEKRPTDYKYDANNHYDKYLVKKLTQIFRGLKECELKEPQYGKFYSNAINGLTIASANLFPESIRNEELLRNAKTYYISFEEFFEKYPEQFSESYAPIRNKPQIPKKTPPYNSLFRPKVPPVEGAIQSPSSNEPSEPKSIKKEASRHSSLKDQSLHK